MILPELLLDVVGDGDREGEDEGQLHAAADGAHRPLVLCMR